MNKLKEQLRFKMLGQLSDERTKEDIDNAYDIAVDFCLSFTSFVGEKEFKTENFIEKVAQVKNNNYICKRGTSPQIKIEEL